MSDDAPPPKDTEDLYETLGVSSDASVDDIAKAYRRLARAHHPDADPAGSSDQFRAATDAYDVLRDRGRRSAYDSTRRSRAAAARAAAGVRIPVHHVAGRPGTGARTAGSTPPGTSGSSGELVLTVTFDQAALGTTAVIEVSTTARCPTCHGSTHAAQERCWDCAGAGFRARVSGGVTIRHACQRCDGTGRQPAAACQTCDGSGEVPAAREVTVRVPPGVEDGARLRFRTPGEAGSEMTAVVRVGRHPYFERRGRDLALRLPITLAEAALGAVVSVPTLRSAVAMRIPPGTPHGRTFRLRERGVPHPDRPGDLLVTAEVVVPTELNDTQRTALEAFATATPSPRAHLEGTRT